MDLRAGLMLGMAPLFAGRLAWPDRLRINGGAEVVAARVHPRTDWRPLELAELALVVREANQSASGEPAARSDTYLVSIPSHLQRLWWTVAEQAEELDGDLDGFESFVSELAEFLRFKRLPLPPRCRYSIIAGPSEQAGTDRITTYAIGGGLRLSAASTAPPHLLGGINLGDEALHVVLLNRSVSDLQAAASTWGSTGGLEPAAALTKFFVANPTYPLVRVRLDAGEGLWFPASGIAFDVCAEAKDEPEVMLTIWEDG